jgi:catechol 2,3-dioxygenase-like lactoylglutathione lyase family enzyme
MEAETFGDGRTALRFANQKINLHPDDSDWHPRADNPTVGGGDFCLITETPIAEVVRHLEACGVEIEVPPSTRAGAMGPITSVYFRDPDGNLVEVSNYP